ncbi:TadE/TadG family type IV pilus assembly protein [Aurantiacibacter aquimixticola]|uniref:Putative Flp pilus-assembly TadG-like N-terminal domain-containing protein n=1 Tax=Aurantiacibacter aquimixticola TaxID=1958945 RepID=A0A419RRU8_9SPHN|nr:Tad domain-containing protein [Aurantiacibacter aquimixticola]RJY08532.1 hypothetical protein D6201_03395 [Aurantiacibacter aquimixticola]
MKNLASDQSGNVLMMSAAAFLPLMMLVGSAVDMGAAYIIRGKLQNACDAAVLAGRQSMRGTEFTAASEREARKFFDFNFAEGSLRTSDREFNITQNPSDRQELLGSASASFPTFIMQIFGFDSMDLSVDCEAKRDEAHNDIALVLDVTGSMADSPVAGGQSKIELLQNGALGLYRALADAPNSQTRYAIVPYSHTVNVGGLLANKDILRTQNYVGGNCNRDYYCWPTTKSVHIDDSSWKNDGSSTGSRLTAFRRDDAGCIEERPSRGQSGSSPTILASVTRADVDEYASGNNDIARQFGRYDPAMHHHYNGYWNGAAYILRYDRDTWIQTGCPARASGFSTFTNERSFDNAIKSATSRVTGGTYHDVGMLWGLRLMSRTGLLADTNPTEIGAVPVNQHIVFMTDGRLDTGSTLYSGHGVEAYQNRTSGSGDLNSKHLARFHSTCDLAKSMGITTWVIALDVTDTDDIEPCATSADHFYISDGSDLEGVFESIGQGIGNLRLSR